jgi:hypothetical protein
MARMNYALVDEDMDSANLVRGEKRSGAVVVLKGNVDAAWTVTRRVEEVLELQFANGSMPA